MKKVIINADDFGYSKDINEAIKLGFINGIITSSSLMANMDGFNHAIYEILPQIPFLFPGFHFNIIEGKCLSKDPLLCGNDGNFNNGFIKILSKSTDKKFLNAIEKEFRLQLEKLLNAGVYISHVDSHVHIHAIPSIFNLIVNLSNEYKIKYIRTHKEIPYLTKAKFNQESHFTSDSSEFRSSSQLKRSCYYKNLLINTCKNMLLNSLNHFNQVKICPRKFRDKECEQFYNSDERIFRSMKSSISEQTRECEGELNDKRSAVKHSNDTKRIIEPIGEINEPVSVAKRSVRKENSRLQAQGCDTRLNINTNDFLIGVMYTGMMSEETIIEGLKHIKDENSLTEIIIHPSIKEHIDSNILPKGTGKESFSNRYREFLITQSPTIKSSIKNLDFELYNFENIT